VIPRYSTPKWFSAEIWRGLNRVRSVRKQVRKKSTPAKEAKLVHDLQAQIAIAKENYIK